MSQADKVHKVSHIIPMPLYPAFRNRMISTKRGDYLQVSLRTTTSQTHIYTQHPLFMPNGLVSGTNFLWLLAFPRSKKQVCKTPEAFWRLKTADLSFYLYPCLIHIYTHPHSSILVVKVLERLFLFHPDTASTHCSTFRSSLVKTPKHCTVTILRHLSLTAL